MSIELALGIIGTLIGLTSLIITIWKSIQEKLIIEISDVLLNLEKQDQNKIVGKLSFMVEDC